MNSRPCFCARAVHDFSVNLPFGVDDKAAYQTFNVQGRRGTIDVSVKIVVDAVFSNVTSLELQNHTSECWRGRFSRSARQDL
jgi:hypothetical protein